MEDILASIRRIIADDQSQAVHPSEDDGVRRPSDAETERSASRARTPYDDVLDLARMGPAAQEAEPAAVPATHQGDGAARRSSNPGLLSGQAKDAGLAPSAVALRARLPEPRPRAHGDDEEPTMLDHPTQTDDEDEALLSAPLGASVLSAFETLAATVVLQNQPMLERVMRDLLRPMLKTWLDDNLPGLVERLVRGEIERVARGVRD